MRPEMVREIKIIKRVARDLLPAESLEKAEALGRNEVKETSPLQMTRTIKEWVSARRQKAADELLAAQSLKRLFY
jgi:hypothetical protein